MKRLTVLLAVVLIAVMNVATPAAASYHCSIDNAPSITASSPPAQNLAVPLGFRTPGGM